MREFSDDSGTFVKRIVEILRAQGQSLGFYICQGDGWGREDGMFVSRINLGSMVETNGLLGVGDEIVKVNGIDVTKMPLEKVAVIMRYVKRLFLTVKVLTPPSLVRLGSYRSQHTQLNATSSTDSGDYTPVLERGERKGVSPTSRRGRIVFPQNEPPVPYAYTRIGSDAPEDEDDMESPGYETVRHRPLVDISGWITRDAISTESLRTLGSRHTEEETGVNVIDCESIDQSLATQEYSGQLTLVLDTVDSLIPPSDDAPLICSVSCDSQPTVEVSIATRQLDEGVAKIQREYHVQLTHNHTISLSLVNGLLSSVKTIPIAYFFPNAQTTTSRREFALTLSPIGRLRFSLAFSPLPSAIPRCNSTSSPAGDQLATPPSSVSGPNLPLVVGRAIRVVEEYGIDTPGLYQITVDLEAKREALAACQSDNLQPSFLRSIVPRLTVHAFTGVLKDTFFNLPQPIFTTNFTAGLQDAVDTAEGQIGQNEGVSLASFIDCLPDGVNTTATALLTHLRTVCQNGATNKTSVDKISQIFAPLLFAPAHGHEDQRDELISRGNFTGHAQLLKTLILNSNQ